MSEKETKIIKREDREISPASFMQQALTMPDLKIEVMEKLMDLYDRFEAKKAKKEFDEAMAAFQGECPVITKGKPVKNKDGSWRYSYAPLDQIVKQAGPKIAKHGLSYGITAIILKSPEGKVTGVEATVNVTHRSGHTQPSSFQVPVEADAFMNAAQHFGSALTYAKRYAFCNAFGILTQDSDTDANKTVTAKGGIVAGGLEYEKAMRIIQRAKTTDELDEFTQRIGVGRNDPGYTFNNEQCEQLLRLIDARKKAIAAA